MLSTRYEVCSKDSPVGFGAECTVFGAWVECSIDTCSYMHWIHDVIYLEASLFIFCPNDLSIGERVELKSPTMTELFSSVS